MALSLFPSVRRQRLKRARVPSSSAPTTFLPIHPASVRFPPGKRFQPLENALLRERPGNRFKRARGEGSPSEIARILRRRARRNAATSRSPVVLIFPTTTANGIANIERRFAKTLPTERKTLDEESRRCRIGRRQFERSVWSKHDDQLWFCGARFKMAIPYRGLVGAKRRWVCSRDRFSFNQRFKESDKLKYIKILSAENESNQGWI